LGLAFQFMVSVKDDLMRVQHWLTAIFGIALLLPCGNKVSAQVQPGYYQQPGGWSGSQQPYPQSTFYGSGPGNGAMATEPAFFPDPQGGFTPSMSPLMVNPAGQAGYQPEMQPWPAISPYQSPAYSGLRNTNGMWQYDISTHRGRRYTGSVEFIHSSFKRPKGVFGVDGGQSHPFTGTNAKAFENLDGPIRYKDIVLPQIDETLADDFQGDAPNADFPFGFFPNTGQPGFNYYDRANAGDVSHARANGLRIRWGFLESGDSGFQVDGWWTGPGIANFDARNTVGGKQSNFSLFFRVIDSSTDFLTPIFPFVQDEVINQNLLNLRGLPINDGTLEELADGSFIGGTSIPYDLEFRLKYKSEAAGTSVNILMTPIVRKKNFKVRPLFGARYVYLKEEFNFFGHDSGLAYDDQQINSAIFPQVKLHSLPNGVEATAGDGRFVRLDLVAAILGVEHPGRYQAFIDNAAVSHLIGPEIGLQYDIGGKRVKLRGHTKFALLANFEKMSLKGNNIGEANAIGQNINVTDPALPTFDFIQDSPLITPTLDNPSPNAFRDDVDQSHVSPLFEQSLFLDVPVFEHIPYLKRMSALDEAKLTLGWTFTFVAEVARPSESILYNANPRQGLFPTLDIKRSNWWTSNWSVGVEIPY
jgi:hypothetical protein